MKSIKYITCIIFTLVLSACSTNEGEPECFDPEYIDFDESLAEWGISFQNVCRCVTDAVKYPEPWTIDVERNFVISDKTIRSMSTCGLLETWAKSPKSPSSDIYILFSEDNIAYRNNMILWNKMTVEFFDRSDFYPVLISNYLSVIKVSEYDGHAIVVHPYYIELLLSSDMCISALSEKENIQLMAMALERTKYTVGYDKINPCFIMIAIMKSCKYTPFTEIDPIYYNDNISIIIEYANQFLNEQKL